MFTNGVSLEFNNVVEFSGWLPCQIKIVKEDCNCFFGAISCFLADTKALYANIRLKVTHFIKSNEEHVQNAEAYLASEN